MPSFISKRILASEGVAVLSERAQFSSWDPVLLCVLVLFYRSGGEVICRNNQVQGRLLETAVWQELCELRRNPRKLEQKYEDRGSPDGSLERIENFTAQRLKLQHAIERLIDGFTEG